MTDPTLNDAELGLFQDVFYRRTGIVFASAKRYFVERRLVERMRVSNEKSVRTYLQLLKRPEGDAEMQQLINAMTVNETYFYRETYQFDCLRRSLLPELTAGRPGCPISIWSLPCSTGEEPYSIALWLLETWPMVDEHEVTIRGSDIDTRTIAEARAGVYNARSVQHLPQETLARYFERLEDGRWRLIPALRGSVEFSTINLMDRGQMVAHRGYDVVFCRNLLIYFDDASRLEAAKSLYDALRPGGFLCLGHSETMSRINGLFVVRKFPDGIVYQKPA